ncbi:MAG: hypothetical protein O2960_24790 [Verrucomicrobia bacterium]|nr:hypothetical protein [Verrucomicrobiota bacterium]
MPENQNDVFPLKTLPPEGRAPKARLDDAKKAQDIYWILHRANQLRNLRGTYIQGMFDGNPPYKQSALRNQAQGWRANFNSLEGKARKDAAKTPYYDLFSSTPTYADVRTEVDGPQLDRQSASDAISEEFYEMLRSWPGFDLNFWKMLDDFVGFSRGWLWWPDMLSWHFKRIAWWRVLFPDGTDVDPDEWSLFAIEHIFDPTTLNGYIQDEESARAAGWNVEVVRQAIINACPVQPNNMRDTMLVQQAVRDQDIYLTTRASTVQAASVYVREFDGSWSRMIVQTGMDSSNPPALQPNQWLFKKDSVAKSVRELMASFFFEVENGSVNGLGGLGRDIFDVIKTKDRMRCEQVNNVFMRSTILLQAQTASSQIKAGLIQVGGGVTVVPVGMNIQQSTMIGDVQTTMVVNQDLDNMLDKNTGIYRPTFEKPQGNPETATAASQRFAQATVLTNSSVNRFYQQLDWFYDETYRRASQDLPESSDPGIKSAREFQKRCRERGVSDKQLRTPRWVRASRAIGNGSPAMRQQLTSELAPVSGQFGQRGQRAWLKDYVAARGGQAKVDRYLPPQDEADLPSEQDREALQENASMMIGAPVVIVENDNHPVHLRRHFEGGFSALESVQQGADPNKAAAFLQQDLPHIEQHIQLLARPEMQKEAIQAFKQLEQGLAQLMSAIQQSEQDADQQARSMSDIELKNLSTQSDIQRRDAKAQSDMSLKQQKALHQMGLSDATTASQITQQVALTRTKIETDRIKSSQNAKKTQT